MHKHKREERENGALCIVRKTNRSIIIINKESPGHTCHDIKKKYTKTKQKHYQGWECPYIVAIFRLRIYLNVLWRREVGITYISRKCCRDQVFSGKSTEETWGIMTLIA